MRVMARSFTCPASLGIYNQAPVEEFDDLDAKMLWADFRNADLDRRSWDEVADEYILICTPGKACLMCAETGQGSEAEPPSESTFQLCLECVADLGREMGQAEYTRRRELYKQWTEHYRQGHDFHAQARMQVWLYRATTREL